MHTQFIMAERRQLNIYFSRIQKGKQNIITPFYLLTRWSVRTRAVELIVIKKINAVKKINAHT